jgi:hypothetical protein
MDAMQPGRRLGDDGLMEMYSDQSGSCLPPESSANYGSNASQFMAQSWPPQPSALWNESYSYSSQFDYQAAPPAPDLSMQEPALYPTPEDSSLGVAHYYKYKSTSSFNSASASYPQPYVQPINHASPDYGSDCRSQTPQASLQIQPVGTNVAASDGTEYPPQFTYGTHIQPKAFEAAWIPIGNVTGRGTHVTSDSFPDPTSPEASSGGLALDWSTSTQGSGPSITNINPSYQAVESKRKHTSPEPSAEKSKSTPSKDELDEFVVVFESAPGALATVKRRRKLDAPVRKAARDVRKAGACHQCRFRKRTVSQLAMGIMVAIRLTESYSVQQVLRAPLVSKMATGFMNLSARGKVRSLGSRCISV